MHVFVWYAKHMIMNGEIMKRYTLISNVFILSALALNNVSASDKDMVFFVGADSNGVKTEKISIKDYQNLIVKTQDSFNGYLNSEIIEERALKSKFKLKTIALGIGSRFEIGIGPWKAGMGIRQRFYYKR